VALSHWRDEFDDEMCFCKMLLSITVEVSLTLEKLQNLYMFETFRIILNLPPVKKNDATLGNVSNSKPKVIVT